MGSAGDRAVQCYEKFLSEITGQDIHIKEGRYNNVIGALASNDFAQFENNFKARITRLNDIENEHEAFVEKAKCIANNSWNGAYSELAVYDWLASDIDFPVKDIEIDVKLDPAETYALDMGKQGVDVDGWIEELGLYYDVKSLHDNTGEFIEKVIDHTLDICYPNQQKRPLIVPSFYTNACTRLINETAEGNENLFKKMVDELSFGICCKSKRVKSSFEGLEYNISYDVGIGMKSLEPYHRASVDYRKILSYSYKFTKNKPFVLFLVSFPWFNREINNFSDFNIQYYRALARRVFCQFKNIHRLASAEIPGFEGNETIFNVTRKISAIIFLEDNIINADEADPDESMIKSYIYTNPNADNPIRRSYIKWFTNRKNYLGGDDFRYDNY